MGWRSHSITCSVRHLLPLSPYVSTRPSTRSHLTVRPSSTPAAPPSVGHPRLGAPFSGAPRHHGDTHTHTRAHRTYRMWAWDPRRSGSAPPACRKSTFGWQLARTALRSPHTPVDSLMHCIASAEASLALTALQQAGRLSGGAATKKLRIVTVGLGGARKWSLNEGHSPNFRGVRVHVSTGYNRVEGDRRASRNASRAISHPKSLRITIRNFLHRCRKAEGWKLEGGAPHGPA
jgi:hypothetical protein